MSKEKIEYFFAQFDCLLENKREPKEAILETAEDYAYVFYNIKPNIKPKIICLCGSTKFKDTYEKITLRETLKGKIVLSVGCFMHYDNINITEKQKNILDELHLRKIDLADEILVLNVNKYIGESTRNEIEYAKSLGKKIILYYC